MQRLRQAGFRFALDDFGTGYSGPSYLDQFEFDYLKIDRSITQAIGQGGAISAVLDAVVDLGHRLNLVMVAEGVETHQQRSYFEERGVRLAQGWLFSSALSISELTAFLARDRAPAT